MPEHPAIHDLLGGGSPFVDLPTAHDWATLRSTGPWRPKIALRRIDRGPGGLVRRWVVTFHERA